MNRADEPQDAVPPSFVDQWADYDRFDSRPIEHRWTVASRVSEFTVGSAGAVAACAWSEMPILVTIGAAVVGGILYVLVSNLMESLSGRAMARTCTPDCPDGHHYHVWATRPGADGRELVATDVKIEPYPEDGVWFDWHVRRRPRWRRWLRRIVNRESRIETHHG